MTVSIDQSGHRAAENASHLPAIAISAAGLRRVTPGTQKARQHAQAYRLPGAPRRTRAAILKIVKRAAAAMGLKSAKMALIDQLFAASRPIDWSDEDGIGPVVWPSNAHLARMMGTSEITVSRHLGDLSKAGLISYIDSPTCRRHGKRDGDGRIVEARGIDLSPMAMRYEELCAIAEAAEATAREKKQLRDRRSVLIKNIRSLIAAAMHRLADDPALAASRQPDWNRVHARLDVLRERRIGDVEELAAQVGDLEALNDDADALYDKDFGISEEVSDLYKNDDRGHQKCIAHTTTAPTSNSGICNQSGTVLTDDTQSVRAAYGSMALEEKPDAYFINNKQSPVETESQKEIILPDAPAVAMQLRDETAHLSIGLLRAACPEIVAIMPGALDGWTQLRDSGQGLCIATGVNPQVWQEAADTIGPDLAVAATAVTLQKAATGTVANPGAYLRTLTKRGKAGNLNILRSLHGLASHNDPANWGDLAQTSAQTPARAPARQDEPTNAGGRIADTPARPDGRTQGRTQGRNGPAVAESIPFPATGTILYSPWADIVRQNTPKPVPDVDIVANEFRRFCKKNAIDTTSPNITNVFTTFCRKRRAQP